MARLQHLPLLAWSVLAVLLLSQISNAQQIPPAIEWQKSLGGSGLDAANSIQQTSDGGYIVAGKSCFTDIGMSKIYDSTDYWIVKLTSMGEMEWQRPFGGMDYDEAKSIKQTSDGGYIVAGVSSGDYWIVKLTNKGMVEWHRLLGGSGGEVASSITQTSDGGYIVAGACTSNDRDVTGHHEPLYNYDIWIVKLTNTGVIQWQKSLGGSESDGANSIIQTSDGGFIVAGSSESDDGDVTGHHRTSDSSDHFNYSDFWVVKLTSTGQIEWEKSLGGGYDDVAKSIIQTSEGGYIVAGSSESDDGEVTGHHGAYRLADYWIVKLTNTGEIEWRKSLGGSGGEVANSIAQTSDGGYIVAGWSWSNDGDVSGIYLHVNYWVVKLSNTGGIEWQKMLGGTGDDRANSIAQTSDGGYIVAGWSWSVDGNITEHRGAADFWIVKLAPATSDVQQEPTATLAPLTIHPNPAHTTAMLKIQSPTEAEYTIELISPLGEVVKRQSAQLGLGEQTVPLTNLESLPAGSYEVIVSGGGKQVARGRLVVVGK